MTPKSSYDVLPATGSGDNDTAIKFLRKIKVLLSALGRAPEFAPFITELRVQHKRKRNFIALLNQQRW
ncbi:MAG: hypothetical protein HQL37_15120 [Alphaproteobacteria bacterium]|nr:hypothetical protein [Alphaproteobacteria bacterium]